MKKMDPSKDGIGASLLLGHAGIHAVASVIYEGMGESIKP